jgi:hypothetical protein
LFADEEPLRLRIADALGKRYHFFHPMLEFIEVFWLRDGFDIICGNPPWLKLEFEQQDVIGEKYPEVIIRDTSAPEVAKTKDKFLSNTLLKSIFDNEQTDCICSGIYMNAFANYPLLQGQQTDLYKCVLENSFDMVNNNGYIGMLHPESVYDDPKGQPLRKAMYKRLSYHFQYQNALNLFDIAHRRKYSSNIYGSKQEHISFMNINNLFHPSTIDACFGHDGHGHCGGLKDENGKWNISGHKKRIIVYTDNYIKLLSDTFEEGEVNDCAKLVSMHTGEILEILNKLSSFKTKVHERCSYWLYRWRNSKNE